MNCSADEVAEVGEEGDGGLATELVVKTIVLPTIFSLVCVVGWIGNGLVLYVLQFKVARRSITDIYVTNLAVADFIFVSMLPFWIIELALNNRWIFGNVLCRLTSGSTLFHMYASIFFLTAMAVDRLAAIVLVNVCRDFRSRFSAVVGSVFIWFISICLSVVPAVFRGIIQTEPGKYHCTWKFNETAPDRKPFFLVHVLSRSLVGFIFPLLIIAICYTSIAVFLKTRKTRGRLTGKLQDRVTVLVLVVIMVFVVCWLPNQISNVVYAAQALGLLVEPKCYSLLQYYIHMFSTCLAFGHSCMNPILYVIMRKDLKTKIIESLTDAGKKCGLTSGAEKILKVSSCRRKTSNRQAAPEVLIISATKGGDEASRIVEECELLTARYTNCTRVAESPSENRLQPVGTGLLLTSSTTNPNSINTGSNL